MNINSINNSLQKQLIKIIIESNNSDNVTVAKAVLNDIAHELCNPVYNIEGIEGGAIGIFGFEEMKSDSSVIKDSVNVKIKVTAEDLFIDILQSGKVLDSFATSREIGNYSALITDIVKSVQKIKPESNNLFQVV